MPGRSVRICPDRRDTGWHQPLWLIIVVLITWSLGAGYYPGEVHGIGAVESYALGLASALLLSASILAHEFGHALIARRRGVEIEEIDLWLLGGVARMRGRPQRAADELRFALADRRSQHSSPPPSARSRLCCRDQRPLRCGP